MPRPRADKPTYSLTRRGERYYIQWWDGAAARRLSCRTGDPEAARTFLAQFEAGMAAELPPAAPTVRQVLDAYRTDRERRPASPTLGYNVSALARILGDLPMDLLTQERIRNYVGARKALGLRGAPWLCPGTKGAKETKPRTVPTPRTVQDSTIRRELLTLRAAINWAVRSKWITPEQAPHIEAPGAGRPRDRWLTREEAAALLGSARQLHVRVFIALALYTAARRGALLELTWDRVSLDANRIDLGTGAGNKRRARMLPIHPELRPYLELAREARTSQWVIEHGGERVRDVKVGFRNATQRAGLTGVTPHVCRHTAATWMAQRGVPLALIAACLGNTVATVERVYAHHSPEHMAQAMAALNSV